MTQEHEIREEFKTKEPAGYNNHGMSDTDRNRLHEYWKIAKTGPLNKRREILATLMMEQQLHYFM